MWRIIPLHREGELAVVSWEKDNMVHYTRRNQLIFGQVFEAEYENIPPPLRDTRYRKVFVYCLDGYLVVVEMRLPLFSGLSSIIKVLSCTEMWTVWGDARNVRGGRFSGATYCALMRIMPDP
ncbi:hypothetical protein L1987_31956 [Smallanthus sonchifolius]|uniref:Uncharacterized protein n=1 Tax=Smallanthus sonchifolius TaxID=185202 RepID=A0ACB9I714_9ASTR|nr:hypothetical protein L1987_31956 [Smallanthus sonchifolius]